MISNRADLISAGEALVAVKVRPRRVDAGRIRVFDDDREVTEAFAVRPNGRFEGLVTGLEVGRNVLRPGSGPPSRARSGRR